MRNINTNHPIIQNSNQYLYEKKYISVHSEDRDYSKFPQSSEFEIMLPQEYLNVSSACLSSWSFPANYNVFSIQTFNTTMTFKFSNLYNPGEFSVSDPLLEGIFAALYSLSNSDIIEEYQFLITIEPGFYNPTQMATELTNKFNEIVTNKITAFFAIPLNMATYPIAASTFKNYNRFNIVYNTVNQKLWFGNTADNFIITNDFIYFSSKQFVEQSCLRKRMLPEYNNWGLPSYLGFSVCEAPAYSAAETMKLVQSTPTYQQLVPRFYYGDAQPGTGDNGYWLLPGEPGATVYFLETPYKISFMGPSYIYMEIDGLNCIDETSPWNLSEFTSHTNMTNGIVNSSFAKLAVPTTPLSQWFDADSKPYKYWNPPAERIGKLKFKFRYHNGVLCDFGNFQFSFMLEFNLFRPQQERTYNIKSAQEFAQLQKP